MQSSSPLARLSLRMHQSRQRHGLTGVAQRLALVILPAPPAVAPVDSVLPAPEPVTPEQNLARERARRALIEARQAMSGVIGEEVVVADLTNESTPSAITPDWDQLQAYLEESERERVTLKKELADLRETVRALQSRLDGFEHALPAALAAGGDPDTEQPAAAIEGLEDQPETTNAIEATKTTEEAAQATTPPPEGDSSATSVAAEEATDDANQVRELRERVLRALRDRVFAAGTVGTRVFVSPAPDETALRGMIERFNEDPLVEHAEPVEVKEEDAEAALIRIALRAPMRWEQFGALLERALDLPDAQGDVRWSQGAVQVRLPAAPQPANAESVHDATEPCV